MIEPDISTDGPLMVKGPKTRVFSGRFQWTRSQFQDASEIPPASGPHLIAFITIRAPLTVVMVLLITVFEKIS